MSKRAKILEMFNSKDWVDNTKYFNSDDFHSRGLDSTIEFAFKWNDVKYARKIFRELGYKVLIGHCMYVRRT
jgi:hypothetical protein